MQDYCDESEAESLVEAACCNIATRHHDGVGMLPEFMWWNGLAETPINPEEISGLDGLFICRDGVYTTDDQGDNWEDVTLFEAYGALIQNYGQSRNETLFEIIPRNGFLAAFSPIAINDGSDWLSPVASSMTSNPDGSILLVVGVKLASALRDKGGVGRHLFCRIMQASCGGVGLVVMPSTPVDDDGEPLPQAGNEWWTRIWGEVGFVPLPGNDSLLVLDPSTVNFIELAETWFERFANRESITAVNWDDAPRA